MIRCTHLSLHSMRPILPCLQHPTEEIYKWTGGQKTRRGLLCDIHGLFGMSSCKMHLRNWAEQLLTLLIKDSRLARFHITDGPLLEEPVQGPACRHCLFHQAVPWPLQRPYRSLPALQWQRHQYGISSYIPIRKRLALLQTKTPIPPEAYNT